MEASSFVDSPSRLGDVTAIWMFVSFDEGHDHMRKNLTDAMIMDKDN
jgi:hypothetical protein